MYFLKFCGGAVFVQNCLEYATLWMVYFLLVDRFWNLLNSTGVKQIPLATIGRKNVTSTCIIRNYLKRVIMFFTGIIYFLRIVQLREMLILIIYFLFR